MTDCKSHTLYRMFDGKGRLLYVGITARPAERFRHHQDQKYWWELVTDIKVENFATRAELEQAERIAIATEVPLYNVTHNGKRYLKAPVSATGDDGNRLRIYTVAEVCEMTDMHKFSNNPEQWLTRQIVAGKFRARRIGRQWAMTDADIQQMLDRLANNDQPTPQPQPATSDRVGVPSLASMRRRRVTA